MHEVLVNRLAGLSLPRKSVVRLTDRPDMTLDVYRGLQINKSNQQPISSDLIFLLCLVSQLTIVKCNIGGKTKTVRKPFLQMTSPP